MELNKDLLYQMIGERIRMKREHLEPKLSQAELARLLGVSRTSIVNIEAGRQHPPLDMVWRIAEILGTEAVLLIPRQDEYDQGSGPVKLDAETVAQIEEAASGDPTTRRSLTAFIGRAKTRLKREL